jgi:hypothetical protein
MSQDEGGAVMDAEKDTGTSDAGIKSLEKTAHN